MITSKTIESRESAAGTDRPLIAIVDDDASFLRSVGRLLHSANYAVKTFGAALDFLAALPDSSPQCLVLDVHMPGMTGLELQDRLVAQGHCLPIIFVTAYDTPQTRVHASREGVFGLLLKPFDKDALLNAIQDAVSCQSHGK
jgi:FixJ family two-component response regulator